MTTELAQHIDTSKDRKGQTHRLYALDSEHLFCRDCRTTITVPVAPLTATSRTPPQRKRGPAPVTGPDTCPLHAGQWADTCAPCRSEALAPNDPAPNQEPRA